MPYLKNKYVPDTRFLSDVKDYPADLENYVLKPLFSFAGVGVKIDVTKDMLDEIKDKENYILQKKIVYEPVIETPDVPAKAELRLLFVWNDKPMLVNNLVRLTKGKMVGVDYNKDKTWVGSSIAYFEQ
jgi:glutathionylspermidine synthase